MSERRDATNVAHLGQRLKKLRVLKGLMGVEASGALNTKSKHDCCLRLQWERTLFSNSWKEHYSDMRQIQTFCFSLSVCFVSDDGIQTLSRFFCAPPHVQPHCDAWRQLTLPHTAESRLPRQLDAFEPYTFCNCCRNVVSSSLNTLIHTAHLLSFVRVKYWKGHGQKTRPTRRFLVK